MNPIAFLNRMVPRTSRRIVLALAAVALLPAGDLMAGRSSWGFTYSSGWSGDSAYSFSYSRGHRWGGYGVSYGRPVGWYGHRPYWSTPTYYYVPYPSYYYYHGYYAPVVYAPGRPSLDFVVGYGNRDGDSRTAVGLGFSIPLGGGYRAPRGSDLIRSQATTPPPQRISAPNGNGSWSGQATRTDRVGERRWQPGQWRTNADGSRVWERPRWVYD
jgi:hypothetical protein